MTINEIQSTLDQLKERHPKLDEGLITTMLSAGGWDEVSIKEAIVLFREGKKDLNLPHQDNVSFPELPKLLLTEQINEEKEQPKESLVVSLQDNLVPNKSKSTIPEDLPLKPFESSPNVWTFSRYRDIFHGNEKEEIEPEKKEVVVDKIITEKPKEEVIKNIETEKILKPKELVLNKVPLTKKDEEIIASIGMFLLIVILMVIYMYLNNRL